MEGCNDEEAKEGPQKGVTEVVALMEHTSYSNQNNEFNKECGPTQGQVKVGKIEVNEESEKRALGRIT